MSTNAGSSTSDNSRHMQVVSGDGNAPPPVAYNYNDVFNNQNNNNTAPNPPPPLLPGQVPPSATATTAEYSSHYPDNQNDDNQQNNKDGDDNEGSGIHWGSPTNPTQNDAYFLEGYNAMPPTTSDELWHQTVFGPAPPQGVSYPFPSPPPGAQAPRMGFFQGSTSGVYGGAGGVNTTNLPPPPPLPPSQQDNNNPSTYNQISIQQTAANQQQGWTENKPPESGCSFREWCSLIFSLLVQTCVQCHFVFLAICMGNPDGNVATDVCINYFWDVDAYGLVVRVAYIVTVSVTGFFYLLEGVFNPFREYCWNLRTRVESYNFLAKLADTRPELWYHIQCYHYETRTYRDSKGRTRTKQVRVNTHSATGHYNFKSWRNVGPPPIISQTKAMRIRLDKEYTFADPETKADYEISFASFVAANDRDTHKDVSSGFDISGFEDYFLSMIRDREGETSFHWYCFNNWWYWGLLLFTLSAYFRILLATFSNSMSYTFVKEVKK